MNREAAIDCLCLAVGMLILAWLLTYGRGSFFEVW